MQIIGQTVGNMVNVEREGVQLMILNVDLDELFCALKAHNFTATDEDDVLKRYSLDLPVSEHTLDPCDFAKARDKIIRDKRIDTTRQYGFIKNGDYEPKEGVRENDIIVLWPKEIWAVVIGARKGVDYKRMMRHTLKYFRERGH